jgi:hypothetical protein
LRDTIISIILDTFEGIVMNSLKGFAFEDEKARLEEKLARGEITSDEYWDALQRLKSKEQGFDYDLEKDLFRSVSRTVIKIAIYTLPIIVVATIFYILFFYYSAPKDISIDVSGTGILPASKREKAEIYLALELLRQHSKGDYAFVDEYVDEIEVSGPQGLNFFGKIRGVYRSGPEGVEKRIRIVRDFSCPAHCTEEGYSGADLLTAEFIVHEACHSMQHHSNSSFSEQECYEMQFDFAERVGPKLWEDFKKEAFIYDYSGIGPSL